MHLIRKAESQDAQAIHHLVLPHVLSATDTHQAAQTGFIIWPQSAEAYQQRIQRSPYVAVAEKQTEIVGFTVAYQLHVLQSMAEDMQHEDKIVPHLLSHYTPDTLFIDQICVKKGFQGQGIAQSLEQWLIDQTSNRDRVALIVHVPVKNQASIRFFTSRGFNLVHEIVQSAYTLGIYERKNSA